MRLIFTFLLVLFLQAAHAQEYRFHLYRVEQGLPNDVIKAVTQDSLGFIWIATDDGLVKYDGLRFTTYKSAFRSQYIKGFLNTHNGRLLAIGDLDLIEINNQVDTVVFKTLLTGARTLSDSTIWFPKSIYEDRAGNIWLAEPQAAVLYNGKDLKRYDLGVENRSPVFIRSFTFFEDDDENVYAVSYRGRIFRLDKAQDKFVMLDQALPDDCAYVVFHQHMLYIATGSGVFKASVKKGKLQEPVKILPIDKVSHLMFTSDSTLWVSTFGEDLYRVPQRGEATWDLLSYNFRSINSSYQSQEEDIWLSTDKGIVLIQKNLFGLADFFSQAQFIEGITEDATQDNIYFCNKETIAKLSRTLHRTVIYDDRNAYLQSLQFGKRGLWASNIYEVMLFQNDKLYRRWDFSGEGNFIHDIFLDSKQNVWASQSGNSNVIVITDTLTLKRYPIPTPTVNEINLVREGPHGMYVAASGRSGYLFYKGHQKKNFTDISLPIKFSLQGDFNIYDLAVDKQDVVWIASTEGLICFNHQTIERVDLGEVFTNLSVSSVELLDDRNLLFSNSHGLFRYNMINKEFWLYDENAGLPSNTITGRGIFVDHKHRPWIGTSYGIARTYQSIINSEPTATPYCVKATVSGTEVRFTEGIQAPYGDFITMQFSAITFPENKINMQWRMEGEDSTWHVIENNQLSLTDLWPGQYRVLVRAKKSTGLDWSTPTSVKLIIQKPFWLKPEFIFFVLGIVLIIAWISYKITSRLLNARKVQLEQLVEKRTHDLQHANEELTQRNNELDRFVYSASHDLSAPLKSVLGLIAVSRLENPGDQHKSYLTMMESSVRKLEEFIREVVSYSRNSRMPVKQEPLKFAEMVQSLLNDQQYAPNFSKISFQVVDNTGTPMMTDMMRLKIILNNLISNAIKFHWFEQANPYVNIALNREGNTYVISVEDNGRGIDAEHTSRIFEMFYRASEDSQGSGLGLYILKETVTKLSGKVMVKSQKGKGTVFTILLPAPSL